MADANLRSKEVDPKADATKDAHKSAGEKILHETQPRPQSPAEQAAFQAVDKVAHDVLKTLMDHGLKQNEAVTKLKEAMHAPTNDARNKILGNNNIPDSLKAFENKYGDNASSIIVQSIHTAAESAPRTEARVAQPSTPAERTQPRIAPPATPPVDRAEPRVAQPATTVDRTQVTDQPVVRPAANAGDPTAIMDDARQKVMKAELASKALPTDGTAMPDNLKQVFQSAIDASSKVTPAVVAAAEKQILASAAPGWTKQKELEYERVTSNYATTLNQFSKEHLAAFRALPKDLAPEQKIAAIQKMNDPAAPAFFQAVNAVGAFLDANPAAKIRDKNPDVPDALNMVEKWGHAPAYSNFVYAVALATTKNSGDAQQAQTIFAKADQDKEGLKTSGVQIDAARDFVKQAPARAAAPAESAGNGLPGDALAQAGLQATLDKNLSPEDKLRKAAPLFESAMQAAKSINPDDIDVQKGKISEQIEQWTNKKYQSIAALATNQDAVNQLMSDPKIAEQLRALNAQNNSLDAQRGQSLKVTEQYAAALSQIASEMRAQANGDPANKAKLNSDANGISQKAIKLLRGVGTDDPYYGVALNSALDSPTAKTNSTLNQKRIEEEVRQVARGEIIDQGVAVGKTAAKVAVDDINDSIMGKTHHLGPVEFNPLKMIRPFAITTNVAIDGLEGAGREVPIAKPVLHMLAGFLENFVPSPNTVMDSAAKTLADAKEADPAKANAVVAQEKSGYVAEAFSNVADVLSGQVGLQAPKLMKYLPGAIQKFVGLEAEHASNPLVKGVATLAVGLAGSSLARYAGDYAESSLLGTQRMTAGQIFSHSVADFASAHAANALSARFPGTTGGKFSRYGSLALTSGITNAALGAGEVNPFLKSAKTGQNYTVTDTAVNGLENFVWGAAAAPAGALGAKFVRSSTSGLVGSAFKHVGQVAAWATDTNAGKVVVQDAAEAAAKAAAKSPPGLLSRALATNATATTARGLVFGATGFTANELGGPKDDGHGHTYTSGERFGNAVVNAGKWAAVGALGPLAVKAALKPGDNQYLNAFSDHTLRNTGVRAGVGFVAGTGESLLLGDKTDANGKPLSGLQIGTNAFENGVGYSATFAAAPFVVAGVKSIPTYVVNPTRRALGHAVEGAGNFIKDKATNYAGESSLFGNLVVKPVTEHVAKPLGSLASGLTANTKGLVDAHGLTVRNKALAFSAPISTIASDLSANHKLDVLNHKADINVQQDIDDEAAEEQRQQREQQRLLDQQQQRPKQ